MKLKMPSNRSKLLSIQRSINSNRIPLLIFFSSLFLYLSFAGTRLFFSDEGIILDQFYNLIHGSLALKIAKINTLKGVLISVGNNIYGVFSYSLLILSLPVFFLLSSIEYVYGAHLFFVQIWAISGGIIIYLLTGNRGFKYRSGYAWVTYLLLIFSNYYFFKPIYFPKWGELLSIEFTNILIGSLIAVMVYELFKNNFSQKIGIFASLFVIFATPLSFYAITLKHHSLTVLLTLLSFYFFYKYFEKKENKFIYLAYISAALCVWTRILDGTVLFSSLLFMEIFILKRKVQDLKSTLAIFLMALLPFLIFNYMILGTPFSIIENSPLLDKNSTLIIAKDFISLDAMSSNARQIELLDKLGYTWSDSSKGGWIEILGYTLFFKFVNTFGIFLISPLLIMALFFIVEVLRGKIKLNIIDKFFIIYILMLFATYYILYKFYNKNALISIITDTPMGLEYRYLLIMYVLLLYFVLRISKINDFIQNHYKMIFSLYSVILIISIIYFIAGFPIPFINIYYSVSLFTIIALFILTLYYNIYVNKRTNKSFSEKLIIILISMALAEASAVLCFYYWVVSITYISPSQNFTILPILNIIFDRMYQLIIY
jgi:4-amino-4-deoxy-L-arabinose transferase-like glycosyltransferase